jgi:hypothetical protein
VRAGVVSDATILDGFDYSTTAAPALGGVCSDDKSFYVPDKLFTLEEKATGDDES